MEVLRDQISTYDLFLTNRPVTSVTSVVEDGDTLVDGTDFQVNAAMGTLDRLSSDEITTWSFEKATITYVGGYVLPGDDGTRTLPYDIEEACIYTVSARMSELDTTNADVDIRSESLDGIYSASYETNGAKRFSANMGLPQRAVALLAKYRIPMI